MVARNHYATAGSQCVDDDANNLVWPARLANNLLCANDRCLLSGNRLSAAFLTLIRLSHLQPLCKRHQQYFPFSYWLLLVAGDVELNPGLTHPNCCRMSVDEYEQLSDSDTNWNSPTCFSSELPFANSSITSDASLSLSQVLKKISHLNVKKVTGPDLILARLLQN